MNNPLSILFIAFLVGTGLLGWLLYAEERDRYEQLALLYRSCIVVGQNADKIFTGGPLLLDADQCLIVSGPIPTSIRVETE